MKEEENQTKEKQINEWMKRKGEHIQKDEIGWNIFTSSNSWG